MKNKFFSAEELSILQSLQIRGGNNATPLDVNNSCSQGQCTINKGSKCPGDTNVGNCINTACLVYGTYCHCITPPQNQWLCG